MGREAAHPWSLLNRKRLRSRGRVVCLAAVGAALAGAIQPVCAIPQDDPAPLAVGVPREDLGLYSNAGLVQVFEGGPAGPQVTNELVLDQDELLSDGVEENEMWYLHSHLL